MPVERRPNSTEYYNIFKIPRDAISPESEDVAAGQAEAREKINTLMYFLINDVSWPKGADADFDKRVLIQVLKLLRPGLPSTTIDSVSAEALAFRLKVIREITNALMIKFPQFPRLVNWKPYAYDSIVEPATQRVHPLFSLKRDTLRGGLEAAATDIQFLYEHAPVALKNLLAWHIDIKDADALQAGLF